MGIHPLTVAVRKIEHWKKFKVSTALSRSNRVSGSDRMAGPAAVLAAHALVATDVIGKAVVTSAVALGVVPDVMHSHSVVPVLLDLTCARKVGSVSFAFENWASHKSRAILVWRKSKATSNANEYAPLFLAAP